MVRVCATEDCKTSARFNHLGEQKGKFCSRHKEPGMIDIVHPHCKIEGCTTLASFNVPGESRGVFCSQHKLDGMVNVKHRRCAESGCNTRPAFNWKGEEKGAYCNKHKEKGMVNVDKKDRQADARAGGSAPISRRRSKGSTQAVAHDLQQQTQQEGFDPARLSQQLPDLAALATAEANGFMGMQHALQFGRLPSDYANANALGVSMPVAIDPSQRHPQEQFAHQIDSPTSHPGVAGVADMSQASWSAALQEQQRQEAEQRTLDGQQLHPQLPQAPGQQPHASVVEGMDQQLPHIRHHLAPHLQDGDAAQEAQQQHQHHHHHNLGQSKDEHPAEDAHQHRTPQQMHREQQEFGNQHQPEPSLPSAEELRERVILGEIGQAGVAAAPVGSLGHLMLVYIIKFVRETLETQAVTDEDRQQLMMYTDHFSQWPEDKRVEEYAMLHFSWSLGRENRQQAVLSRVEKVLAV